MKKSLPVKNPHPAQIENPRQIENPHRRRPRQIVKGQLVYIRKQAALLLCVSVDTVKKLERQGKLKPIQYTGPRSPVYYARAQVHALANDKHFATLEARP